MSKQISQMSVGLFGDIGNFAQSFGKDALKPVNELVSGITSAGSKLATFTGIGAAVAAGLAVAGTAIGAAFSVKEQFAAIDATAKLSDRFGIATESLVGFQYAAQLSGISTEELTGGIEKMLKTVGEAATVGGTASDALARLGLNAKSLSDESPDQAFKDIAQAISKITSPAERAAAAVSVFGKSGESLLPLLSKGVTGISAAQAEAQRLGLTFNRVDAAKIEAANESVIRMKSVFTGLSRTVAIAIAPLVESGVGKLTGIIQAAIPTIEQFGAEWGAIWPSISGALSNVWQGVTTVWNNVYGYITAVGGEIYDAISSRWEAIVESNVGYALAIWDTLSATWGAMVDLASVAWEGVVSVWEAATGSVVDSTDGAGSSVTSIFGRIIDAGNWLRDGITFALNVAEYAITHWRDVCELEGTEVALGVVRVGNQIAYIFQEYIPTFVGYGIAVAVSKFTNFSEFTATIFENLGGNIVAVFKNLPGLISGKTSWAQVWTPLTKGFEETVIEWPGIAAREKGELEKQLEDESTYLENNFAQGLGDHLAKRQSEAETAGKGITNAIKKMFTLPKVKAPEMPKVDAFKPKLDPNDLKLSIVPEIKRSDIVLNGSAEAQSLAYLKPDAVEMGGIRKGSSKSAGGSPRPSPIPAPAIPQPVPHSEMESDKGGDSYSSKAMAQILLTLLQTYMPKIQLNTRTPQFATSST